MASPRSMWSGNITLGLLNVPVSIGKCWSDERESSLRDLCSCHGQPVDRTERCSVPNQQQGIIKIIATHLKARDLGAALDALTSRPTGKVKGVKDIEGEWRKLAEGEMVHIENATKSDSLEILDVQPVHELPLEYGTGSYYVRYNPPKKGSTAGLDAFANFVAALQKKDRGVVVKWCKSARQQLSILHTTSDGLLLLTTVPFENELRSPGTKERAHSDVPTDKKVIGMMEQILDAQSRETGFRHDDYRDEGLRLRSEVVDKILGGQEMLEKKGEQNRQQAPDLMAQLQASMEALKVDEKEKA